MAAVQNLDMFMSDPLAYFDQSITRMHMISRPELEELQRQALRIRVAEHIDGIDGQRVSYNAHFAGRRAAVERQPHGGCVVHG